MLPLVPRNMSDVTLEAVRQGQACVLQLEPPVWQSDSSSPHCSRCRAVFGYGLSFFPRICTAYIVPRICTAYNFFPQNLYCF